VPIAAVPIVNRTSFASALLIRLAAGEAEPDSKAAKEMQALWRLVEKELAHAKAQSVPKLRAGSEITARADR
jgi:hypothetical protein